jgi:diacylglycerol O-acyltransferase / wax synthase
VTRMAERELRFERTMSDQEALMWALEQDPVLRSTFAVLTFFEGEPDLVRFRAKLDRALALVPRLRQRVVDPPGRLGPPVWADDPLFDLDYHIRHVAVPPPGTERQVLDLAATLSADPFDRARPLWQFVRIDGLADGRSAMFQKLHHTLTDGEGGVRLSALFLDVEPNPPEPTDVAPEPSEPEPTRGPADTVRDAVSGALRLPVGLARRALSDTVDTLTHPARLPERAAGAVEASQSVLRMLAVTEPARSPLWGERSLRRHLEILSIPLDDVKRAAKALGGTVNDLFVTGAVGAAGAYHQAKGVPVDQLRMAMPVSTRTDKGSGANAFAPTRLLVPAGIEDPAERFDAIRAVVAETRQERAIGLFQQLSGVFTALPAPLLVRVARQQVSTVDFTASNVRGAPFDLWIAGARLVANYPIGPMAGTAFNLTTMSYRGNLDMGCSIDTAAVDDPALLRQCLVEAYDELLARG